MQSTIYIIAQHAFIDSSGHLSDNILNDMLNIQVPTFMPTGITGNPGKGMIGPLADIFSILAGARNRVIGSREKIVGDSAEMRHFAGEDFCPDRFAWTCDHPSESVFLKP